MAYPKVTVVGAGNVGATTAQTLVMKDIADVVLVDVVDGLPQGKALDMMHMRSIEKFGPTIIGTNDYADTQGSDVVVITAGVPRKPGMTREDLLSVNSGIMESVISQVVPASPDAVIICVTNPLDVMTYLAYTLAGIPSQRLMGMGGVLDSARFAYAIQQVSGADITDIDAITVGAHGEAMLPLPRFSTIAGKPITQILDDQQVAQVRERTIKGGAEVVSLLKTGSAFYAPAASIARMVQAIIQDTGEVMSVCALLQGEYGIDDLYMCVPVELGREGVRRVVEFDLDAGEMAELQASAQAVRDSVKALGK